MLARLARRGNIAQVEDFVFPRVARCPYAPGMLRRPRRTSILPALVALATVFGAGIAPADEPPGSALPVPSPAALWLQSIESPPAFQEFLDGAIRELRARDPGLAAQTLRVALIEIPETGPPQLAHWKGSSPVYPASVPKFVYLMAAYAWRDQGRLEIDSTFDRQLQQMIYISSNGATQKVVARLTDTQPGPRLEPEEYREFSEKRHAVKRWLRDLGITDLHMVHPTYNGGGDIFGRELQFLEDPDVEGSLPNQTGPYRNRQAMTAVGSAQLLALLATDRALSPESSAEVRERMRRDPRRQPYLQYRIAGGAARSGAPGLEVFSKTGTWGPIHADAGILRGPSGRQLVVAAFLEGSPRYRGAFIADLTARAARRFFTAWKES
jgi:beta-lactamase class A